MRRCWSAPTRKTLEIEIWKQATNGQYVLLKTYPVCRWSGQLGPKKREGDRQVPEGFYTVAAPQMNPNSAYWLSFNVGYPNQLERAMGRNGGDIMVHGTCSSRGCFAMTNEQVEEIYAVMREAFQGGQKQVQFQSYPFRMTAENIAKFRHDPNMPFWKNLKEGNDHFEVTKTEPAVGYCGGKYVFNAAPVNGRLDPTAPCPALKTEDEVASAVASKEREDDAKVAEYIHRGTPAVRVQYSDGSQHPSFRTTAVAYLDQGSDSTAMTPVAFNAGSKRDLGDVSRPDAIDATEEFAVDETGQRKVPKVVPVAVAAAPASVSTTASIAPAPKAVASAASASTEAGVSSVAKSESAAKSDSVAKSGGFGLGMIGNLFGGPAQPAATATTASNLVPSPQAPAPAANAPFYKRWLGFGEGDAAVEPATVPQPAKVPLPPKRQAQAHGTAQIAMTTQQ